MPANEEGFSPKVTTAGSMEGKRSSKMRQQKQGKMVAAVDFMDMNKTVINFSPKKG